MVGRRLLHFQIVEKLGEGGMGVVYKARDTHLDRLVAIKVLPAEKVSDPERRRRFVQEARAASALNHPNIITVHDITQADDLDLIVMEYVEGKTLDAMIPRAGMRLGDVLKLGVQIAHALAAAHTHGIVHRDLKPANVMVGPGSTVKVVDFGLAKLNEPALNLRESDMPTGEARTGAGVVLGTAAYMSPEQAEGKPVDQRSDIFSFGALLYEMATGRHAFAGDSWASTMAAVLNREPKPLEGLPHDLEKSILRCLRKDPDKRFQHMDDVCVALEELKEESDSGRLGVGVPAPARGLTRRRLMYGAAAACVLLAAAALAWRWAVPPAPPLAPRLVPLTTFPGNEGRPAFSPDGQQVAFVWNGETEDNADIYVKLVGETNALRLTTDPAPESFPAWSPDGKRISFRRSQPGGNGLWLVSPLGGAAQQLTDLRTTGHVSWSPDGKWLAVGVVPPDDKDPRGIVLVPVDGGELRRVSTRRTPAFDVHPSFSPDGRRLAYASCTSVYSCDVFVQQLDAGYAPREAPRRITQQAFLISGLTWSRDGESLIYGGSWSWGLSYRLWRVGIRGVRQPERIDLAGFHALGPCVAPAGDRLAFQRNTSNFDVWRYQLGGVPEPFLKSSVLDGAAHFAPDGSRIAFSSDRSGDVIEMWTVDADGSNPVQLTRGPGRGQATNRWSPDGRLIAFDSLEQDGGSKVYVVDASGGRPRRVSSETADEYNPSWSRDGKRIYFFSSRTGRNEIWRTALGEGVAERVTENGGYVALESADGRTLFYTKAESSPLFARSLDGGSERQVLEYVTASAFAVFEDGIYFIGRLDAEKRYPLTFYEFSTRSSRLLTKTEGPLLQFLSVSPDRKTFLFTRSATEGTDLMLIENFR